MTPSISSTTSAAAQASATQSTSASAGSTHDVTEGMFLQLLVAQLQNQDPLSPTDSTTFVTQLAQFQQLEQSMNMGQDISAMRQDLDTLVADQSTSATTQS